MCIRDRLSPETVIWCAQKRYPYIGLGSALGPTCDLWDLYADSAAELGYQAGPENFGYLLPVFVSDNEAEAQEVGRGYAFGGGQNGFISHFYLHPASGMSYLVAFNTQTTSAKEGEKRNTRALDAAVRDWLLSRLFAGGPSRQ